jgi:CRP-like cAMP-binding protein
MEEMKKYLMMYPLMTGLTEQQIALIYPMISIREYAADTQIFNEDDPGDSIILLLEDKIEVSRSLTLPLSKNTDAQNDTREKALIRLEHTQHPFLGEMSLLDENARRSATIKTVTACKLGIINNQCLLKLCKDDLSIGFVIMTNIIRKLSSDLRQANQSILKLTTALNLILEK